MDVITAAKPAMMAGGTGCASKGPGPPGRRAAVRARSSQLEMLDRGHRRLPEELQLGGGATFSLYQDDSPARLAHLSRAACPRLKIADELNRGSAALLLTSTAIFCAVFARARRGLPCRSAYRVDQAVISSERSQERSAKSPACTLTKKPRTGRAARCLNIDPPAASRWRTAHAPLAFPRHATKR